jgi:hypothetical protein
MEHEPILRTETEKIISRLAYHEPFKVQLPNKREYRNRFNPYNKDLLVQNEEGTGAGVNKLGSKRGIDSFMSLIPLS